MMSQKITTLIIDMYGVILKDRTGNFVPYTYEHFDVSEHGRIKDLLENQKLFTKAGLGHIANTFKIIVYVFIRKTQNMNSVSFENFSSCLIVRFALVCIML